MNTLYGQKFYDFFAEDGKWEEYIRNRIGLTKLQEKKRDTEIKEEIAKLFRLK